MKKGLKAFIIAVLIVGLCGITYGILSFVNRDKLEDDIIQEETPQEENSIQKANETLSLLGIDIDNMYGRNYYNIDYISDYEVITTALLLTNDGKSRCSDKPRLITYDELNEAVGKYIEGKEITEEMFLRSARETSKGTIYTFFTKLRVEFEVEVESNGVRVYLPCGYETPPDIVVQTKVVDASNDGDTFTLYKTVAFGKLRIDYDNYEFYYDYYREYDLYYEVVDTLFSHISSEDGNFSWDKYNTYAYTFKVKNGNYYLQEIELVRG